jgi:uncharacterized protein
MKIINVFDAIKEGTYDDFISLYDGNVNQVNQFTKLNLLETAVVNDKNADDKKLIINYLISQGIDVNFKDDKFQRNALHILFFNVMRGDNKFLMDITRMLIDVGIEVNAFDKFGAIPLKYAITVNKLTMDDMRDIFVYLIQAGSDYRHKDDFKKSCINYAEEYSWRNGFIDLVKEFEDGK